MSKIIFKVEKNVDEYWGHRTESSGLIGACGASLAELRSDAVTAYNLFQDEKKIAGEDISVQFDVTSFFELYSGIVAAARIGKRAGMKKSLIS